MDCAAQGSLAPVATSPSPVRWLLLGGLLATLVWTAALVTLRLSRRRFNDLQVGAGRQAAAPRKAAAPLVAAARASLTSGLLACLSAGGHGD